MRAVEALPGGIVTFLFSDVEGSTRLAAELGDARWAELLEEHRRILRRAFSAHGGREVDAQGDAFFVAFARPTDAMAAAVEAQRALEESSWPGGVRVRVRLGLHTGEALVRGDHYVGQEVHRASRICDAGHGGQIVVSQTTAELVRRSLPAGATLIDLGPHRLKGLGDVQWLFQISATGLCSDFPRLRSLDAPHNLPAERSPFIGREEQIGAIRKLLAGHRLVTLTGIGGSGKTRLALQVAARELDAFPDGAFFVDLAPLSDPDLVAQSMATACGLTAGEAPAGVGGSVEDRLVVALARWRSLLIIDNCEHLRDAAADLVDRVLAGCPDVAVIATSREALDVEGEQVVQVPSLRLPEDPAEAEASEAVRLFLARARSLKPDFQLTPDSRAPIVEICRRLDGIPLAIEFAAARVAHLSPRQIADRLQDRFRLLTGGRRRIQRQQTLEAALDWSYELLDEGERALFRRLAVFCGGFSLEAAEAVCGVDGVAAGSVLDLLGSLVAQSLVVAAEDEREVRYRLLETVRLYAEAKLAAAEEAESVRSRHRDWYLAWIESIPFERLSFSAAAFRAAAAEIDNLRAAADWSLAAGRLDLLARLATRMFSFWLNTGSASREGRRRFLEVLQHEERLSTDERVACHAVLSAAPFSDLELQAAWEAANRAIELADGRPSPFLVIAMNMRAFADSVRGAFPGADPHYADGARRTTQAAIATTRSGMPLEWRAYAELFGWMTETNLGDARAAANWARACTETCDVAAEPGYLRPAAIAGLAVSHHLLGETDAALRAAREFLALPDLRDTPLLWGTDVFELTPALIAGGEVDLALEMLRDAVREVRRTDTPMAENHLLSIVGVVEQLRGHPERAGRLLAAARYLGGAADLPIPFRTPASTAFYSHYLPIVRAALGPLESRRARDEGRALTLDDALAYALESLG
jgi:predicted ATPase/class 3 adenylate cyclase